MEIDVSELKAVIDRIFEHIVKIRRVKKVNLGADLYWDVPEEALYNVVDEPKGLDIGRLSDDWQFISTLLMEDASPVAYQLTEVAPLLRRLGEVLGRDLAHKGG